MKRKAFTLIELLVVISIIAILMAILMPALSKVKQQAQATICMTNIKNITTACMTYAADNDNKYPLGGSRPLEVWGGGYPGTPYWDARVMPYIDSGYNINPEFNRDSPGSSLSKVNPDIFDVLLCPAAKADQWQAKNIKLIRNKVNSRTKNRFPKSYRLNAMLTGYSDVSGFFDNFSQEAYKDSIKMSKVNNSSDTLLVVESAVTDGSCFNNIHGWAARRWSDVKPTHFVKRSGVIINNYTWEGEANDDKERTGDSNMGFADGHVAKIKRVYTNEYWQDGGEPDTVGLKFFAAGAATKPEEGLEDVYK